VSRYNYSTLQVNRLNKARRQISGEPDFHFQTQYNVCPTLKINVNLMLDSDTNLIFICSVGFGLLNANFVIGAHYLIDNIKANIFILKATNNEGRQVCIHKA